MPKSELWKGFSGAPTAAKAAVGYLEADHDLAGVAPVQKGLEGSLGLGEGEDGPHHGPHLPAQAGEEEAQGLLQRGLSRRRGASQKPSTARFLRMSRRGLMGATSPSAAPM